MRTRSSRSLRGLGLALLSLLAAASPADAATTKIWICASATDFSTGEARGVAVAMDGTLILSKQVKRVEGIAETALFAAVSGRDGTVFLATGDSGKILRVGPAGKAEIDATLPEKEVTALASGPDGALYAGGSPGGKVYRIEKGKPVLYYDTKARYVWSLAFSGDSLYIGTGLPGEIHRVASAGHGERIHATPDTHVRTLYADSQGRIWAGTSGSGLVLRVEKSGAVVTLYDSSKSEITAIAATQDGRVWIAAGSAEVSGGGTEPFSLPVASAAVRAASSAPKEGEPGKEKPEVTVTVSAPRLAPSPSGGGKGGYSTEVLLFEEGEPPRPVWTSSEELVFDLAPDGDRRGVLAATGPKGKLYRLGVDHWSLERTFDEKQVTVLAGSAVGTNSAAALYRLLDGPRSGEYVSPVKDSGRTSRFGAFRWEGEAPAGTRVEFSFRSGESSVPDPTWSPWSPWTAGAQTTSVAAPTGRYLQWKVRLETDRAELPSVRRVEAAYKNRNGAPVIENFLALGPSEVFARSASGGSNVFETTAPDEKGIFTSLEESKGESPPRKLLRKGYRTLTWKASDPDGDTLTYDIDFRPAHSQRRLSLRKGLRDTFYSFDTTALPDGDYVFRLTASDAESNPEEKKTSSRESPSVRIDNTPPVIRRLPGGGATFDFEAADTASPILETEYSVDAKEWIRIEPRDGISDSPTESYSIKLDPKWSGGFLLIRVTDAARNVAAASFTIP